MAETTRSLFGFAHFGLTLFGYARYGQPLQDLARYEVFWEEVLPKPFEDSQGQVIKDSDGLANGTSLLGFFTLGFADLGLLIGEPHSDLDPNNSATYTDKATIDEEGWFFQQGSKDKLYWFWVRAFDRKLNASNFTSPILAEYPGNKATDVEDSSIGGAKFSQDFASVGKRFTGNLPAQGNSTTVETHVASGKPPPDVRAYIQTDDAMPDYIPMPEDVGSPSVGWRLKRTAPRWSVEITNRTENPAYDYHLSVVKTREFT